MSLFTLTAIMAEANIRQRNPFKFVSDVPELDEDVPDRILDEEGEFFSHDPPLTMGSDGSHDA